MSTNAVQSTLSKLETSLGKNRKTTRIDYKELNEQRKKAFMKLKEGKNTVVFVCPAKDSEDPFFVWGYHNSLQEVAFYSVPCNHFNQNENCVICNAIADLQSEVQNKEKNKNVWYPIRQQTEIYAPVINVESDETIAEGLKWLRLSKTIVTQLTEWLRNLEESEEPFYSDDEPQKVIINYKKDEQPVNQYKLDRKNTKPFKSDDLKVWRENLKSVPEYIYSKKEEEMKQILDGYFERVSNEIGSATDENNKESGDNTTSSVVTSQNVTEIAESKLAALKKGH